ncbi:hypothetical protein [Prescottella agglutinans]|uniref:hypothetical protein n=1 Tax=Prescottella agglutinans TaxID=1644129 RepID=UPI003D98E147
MDRLFGTAPVNSLLALMSSSGLQLAALRRCNRFQADEVPRVHLDLRADATPERHLIDDQVRSTHSRLNASIESAANAMPSTISIDAPQLTTTSECEADSPTTPLVHRATGRNHTR